MLIIIIIIIIIQISSLLGFEDANTDLKLGCQNMLLDILHNIATSHEMAHLRMCKHRN